MSEFVLNRHIPWSSKIDMFVELFRIKLKNHFLAVAARISNWPDISNMATEKSLWFCRFSILQSFCCCCINNAAWFACSYQLQSILENRRLISVSNNNLYPWSSWKTNVKFDHCRPSILNNRVTDGHFYFFLVRSSICSNFCV